MDTANPICSTHILAPAIFGRRIESPTITPKYSGYNPERQLPTNKPDYEDHESDSKQDMVSIKVGEGFKAVEFLVPKAPLCQRVAFFNAMFNNGWLEDLKGSCTLPEDDPEAFSILLHWVFDIPRDAPVMFTSESSRIHLGTFVELIVLADKYLLDEFTSLIETRLMQKDLERLINPSQNIPKASWYRLAREISPRDSVLRTYFTRKYGDPLDRSGTLQVTRKMMREWEKILAGHKDIRGDLRKLTSEAIQRQRYQRSLVTSYRLLLGAF
ncbi:hypothetical protein NHQ30_004432 [Ciborinia camelliae]|nr:hypothetical protein NHQ30_004432 [Ciborinia camelliae]